MGRDRQEKKLKGVDRVVPDRDGNLRYPGTAKMSGPEEARKLNDGKK